MSTSEQLDCPTCGTKLTVKQILHDRENYEDKKKSNINDHLGNSLGPDPRDEYAGQFVFLNRYIYECW